MGLLDRIKKTRINSLWSVWYCLAVVGLQIYLTYASIKQYRYGTSLPWGGTTVPGQLSTHLAFIIISVLILPFFCLASVLKIGNYPNDGVKFGRDEVPTTDRNSGKIPRLAWIVNAWRHFCPISQTLHLVSAFLLLVPDTLLTAVEIQHGYKRSEHIWSSDIDFLFPAYRSNLTDLRASGNFNASSFWRDVSARNGDYNNSAPSVAFGNFAVAFVVFSVRFSAVYWYANKILSCIFAVTLLGMSVNSLFAYSAFSVLYKATLNQKRCPEVALHLGFTTVGVLYSIVGVISLLSTIIIFEYGFYFFHERFKTTKKNNGNLVKQTVIVWVTCRGYVPHISAMISLVVLEAFKGPLLFDYVEIYKTTKDQLLISSVVSEVTFMMMWIILWFGLTIKQQWHFKILDYQKVDDPVFTVNKADRVRSAKTNNARYSPALAKMDNITRSETAQNNYVIVGDPTDGGDAGTKSKRSSQRVSVADEDIQIDEADPLNPVIINGVLIRKTKNRRSNPGQRVTFSEHVKTNNTPTEAELRDGMPRNLSRSESANMPQIIRAEVHDRRRNSDPSVMDDDTGNYGYITKYSHDTDGPRKDRVVDLTQLNINRDRYSLDARHGPQTYDNDRLYDSRDLIVAADTRATEPVSGLRNEGASSGECGDQLRDNILARDYRKNIRSKCDEYYMELGSSGSVCSSEMSPRGVVSSLDPENGKRYSNSSHMSDLSSVSSRPSMMSDQSRGPNGNFLYTRLNLLRNKASSPDRSRESPLSETSDFGSKLSSESPFNSTSLQPLEIRINNSPANSFTHGGPISSDNRTNARPAVAHPNTLNINKVHISRRDSANYSMSSSSQETSSNDSESGGLCSQV